MSDAPIIRDVGDEWELGSEFEDEVYEKIYEPILSLVSKQIIKSINDGLPGLRLKIWWSNKRQDLGFILFGDMLLGDGNIEFTGDHVIDGLSLRLNPDEKAKVADALRRMADRIDGLKREPPPLARTASAFATQCGTD